MTKAAAKMDPLAAPPEDPPARRTVLADVALEHRRIPVLRRDLTVHMLRRDLADGTLDLDRPFGGSTPWPHARQARLVESVLLRLPLLPIHVAEDRAGTMHVIDGRERLRSLFAFLDGTLVLMGLRLLPELNHMGFSDLPVRLRRRFEDSVLTVMILGSDTDPTLAEEIFHRLNSMASHHAGEPRKGD